jgi:hypothetical protein
LAWRSLHPSRRKRAQLAGLGQCVTQSADTARQIRLEQLGDPIAYLVERIDAERDGHTPLRAECVDEQGHTSSSRILEQQRGAPLAQHALHDAGHLEVGVDARADPLQVAVTLEGRD